MRLALAAMFMAMAAMPAKADVLPDPWHLITFEPNSASLPEAALSAISDFASLHEQNPEKEVHYCPLFDPDDPQMLYGERGDAIENAATASGLETYGSIKCAAGVAGSLPKPATDNTFFVALYAPTHQRILRDARLFTRPDYVPDTGWSDEADADGGTWSLFYEDWFGDQLSAMREPSFRSDDTTKVFTSRFRFAAFPNYDPAYVVRIDEWDPGEFVVAWVILDGAGGYDPGEVARRGSRRLSNKEGVRFQELIRRADLASKSMEFEPPPDDDGTIFLCMHSTHWTFEQHTKAGWHFLERDFCGYEDEALWALEAFGMQLTDGQLNRAIEKVRRDRYGEE